MAAAPAGSVPQFASLYVGDLHPEVTEAMLYEIFNAVGPVGSIRVCRNSTTRKSLGYAYVNFHSVGDAERALDTLNFSDIKGRACRIMWSQRDPSLRKSGVGNIFVKNLDASIDNKALYDTFSLFGNILSCKVALDHNAKSRGYGFVHYETEEAAKQAIERVNGMQIGDRTVEVAKCSKLEERGDSKDGFTNLYVKNFPQDWTEAKLLEHFKAIGPVSSSVLMTDKLNRKFAFVAFDTAADAQKAIQELNGKDMRTDEQKSAQKDYDGGDYLFYVGKAQTKAERARELGGGKGGGKGDGLNLYVKNLDEDTDDAGLKELFDPFGNVTSSSTMRDERGKCKGFGFVAFSTADEATKAVTEMHLKIVKNKPLYVGLAERKEIRQERLRQRYQPGAGGMGGGKGGCKGKGGGGGGMGMGMGMGMMGGPQGMPGPMNPMMRGPMGQAGGKPGMGFPGQMGMPFGGKPGMMMGMPQMMMGMKGGMPGMQGMNPMMMGGKGMGMMPMGMMRPMMPMPGMKGGFPGMPGQMMMQAGGQPAGSPPISAANLAAATPQGQKQMLGEKLYNAISRFQPELAGKITGMMLEMDNGELLILLESEQQLKAKVDEALRVLQSK